MVLGKKLDCLCCWKTQWRWEWGGMMGKWHYERVPKTIQLVAFAKDPSHDRLPIFRAHFHKLLRWHCCVSEPWPRTSCAGRVHWGSVLSGLWLLCVVWTHIIWSLTVILLLSLKFWELPVLLMMLVSWLWRVVSLLVLLLDASLSISSLFSFIRRWISCSKCSSWPRSWLCWAWACSQSPLYVQCYFTVTILSVYV